jgi:hypothetical protein
LITGYTLDKGTPRQREYSCFELRPLGPASQGDLLNIEEDKAEGDPTLSEADAQLDAALLGGKLAVSAIDLSDDKRKNVPASEWQDIALDLDPKGKAYLARDIGTPFCRRLYERPTVSREALQKLWPPKAKPAKPARRNASQPDIEAWCKRFDAQSEADTDRLPAMNEAEHKASAHFAILNLSVPRRRFRDAFAAVRKELIAKRPELAEQLAKPGKRRPISALKRNVPD